MAYTPELSKHYSAILRRIAWGLGQPMTRTIERVFDEVIKGIDAKMICNWCQDRSFCGECPFQAPSLSIKATERKEAI